MTIKDYEPDDEENNHKEKINTTGYIPDRENARYNYKIDNIDFNLVN